MNKPPTIQSILDHSLGIGPGFDTLRVALSVMIMMVHCFPLTLGVAAADYR